MNKINKDPTALCEYIARRTIKHIKYPEEIKMELIERMLKLFKNYSNGDVEHDRIKEDN